MKNHFQPFTSIRIFIDFCLLFLLSFPMSLTGIQALANCRNQQLDIFGQTWKFCLRLGDGWVQMTNVTRVQFCALYTSNKGPWQGLHYMLLSVRNCLTCTGIFIFILFYLFFSDFYFFHYSWFTLYCQFSIVQQSDPVSLSLFLTHTHTISIFTYLFLFFCLLYFQAHICGIQRFSG